MPIEPMTSGTIDTASAAIDRVMKSSSFRRWRAAAVIFPVLLGCTSPGPDPIGEAVSYVRGYYIRDAAEDDLLQGALSGIMARLDPHSTYLAPEEFRDFVSETRGERIGAGAVFARDGHRVKIVSVVDGGPAAQAGLRQGDILRRIDGVSVDGVDLEDIAARSRGPAGSIIRLTVSHGDTEPFDVTLARDAMRIEPVKARLEAGRLGYARIAVFNERTEAGLVTAIDQLRRKAGGRLDGFVLDLRNDPGGLVSEAVAVASDFLDGGTILTVRGRNGRLDRRFDGEFRHDLLDGVPMVVLVDGATASAAEIVAGALQDYGRAIVMGTRTFGKGSVQTLFPLSNGGALRLTTALYYLPSGRAVQAEGITPDIVVAPARGQRPEGTNRIREADLRGAIAAQQAPVMSPQKLETGSARTSSAIGEAVDPIILGTKDDHQLRAALDALRAGRVPSIERRAAERTIVRR